MTFFSSTAFKKPRPLPAARKPLKKVAKKGDFWLFVGKVLTLFFLKLDLPKVCEQCHGAGYCGPLTPAHSRRRQDIRVGDWHYAFRIACLGSQCHYNIDILGRREAEPIIEKIITDRFKRLGLDEIAVAKLLIECAEEIQKTDERFEEYVVTL